MATIFDRAYKLGFDEGKGNEKLLAIWQIIRLMTPVDDIPRTLSPFARALAIRGYHSGWTAGKNTLPANLY